MSYGVGVGVFGGALGSLVFVLLAASCDIWDLSSLTRDRYDPCIGSAELAHWTTKESLEVLILFLLLLGQ